MSQTQGDVAGSTRESFAGRLKREKELLAELRAQLAAEEESRSRLRDEVDKLTRDVTNRKQRLRHVRARADREEGLGDAARGTRQHIQAQHASLMQASRDLTAQLDASRDDYCSALQGAASQLAGYSSRVLSNHTCTAAVSPSAAYQSWLLG